MEFQTKDKGILGTPCFIHGSNAPMDGHYVKEQGKGLAGAETSY